MSVPGAGGVVALGRGSRRRRFQSGGECIARAAADATGLSSRAAYRLVGPDRWSYRLPAVVATLPATIPSGCRLPSVRPSSRGPFPAVLEPSRRPVRPSEGTPAVPPQSSPKNTTSCGIPYPATTISGSGAGYGPSGPRRRRTGGGRCVDALWTPPSGLSTPAAVARPSTPPGRVAKCISIGRSI